MAVSGRVLSLAVQTMLGTATGRSCGYGTAPTASSLPTGAATPYCVLYPVGSTSDGPPFGDASADARIVYQITSVATTAEQAEWMADKVRSGMLARTPLGYTYPIVATGYAVMSRELDKEEGVAVASGVYSYVQRFAIEVTTLSS
ncbi:hypothetical protein TPA0598_04_03260 [Streptomyces lydicamycinicus]|uniref:Uncharacterized protein n=1 Tax=Streptomyces lydicamycinicus TaxID=1546107 RepID=A0A0P4R6Z1_9ACTN|nr:hypothetical protein [Streptomyces lydicamycinicus]GAO08690.1 hypothetical protein TPA0598_04_03260 [Streptomyces lydicamycinicus]